MEKPGVLIDTSIWVEYFRGKSHELVESVKDLIKSQRAVLCGIALSELLAGVRAKKDRDTLRQTLEALEYKEVSRATWISAGEMSRNLRKQGIAVPLTDLILAALALENKCELFTFDSHFDQIAEIKRFNPGKA